VEDVRMEEFVGNLTKENNVFVNNVSQVLFVKLKSKDVKTHARMVESMLKVFVNVLLVLLVLLALHVSFSSFLSSFLSFFHSFEKSKLKQTK